MNEKENPKNSKPEDSCKASANPAKLDRPEKISKEKDKNEK